MPESTTNAFLLEMLNLFPWSESCGVYASNEMPASLSCQERFSIICNLSRADQPGTHYVSIIRRGDSILYLDPLALYMELNNDITQFINNCNVSEVIKLDKALQHPKSWFCGYFTLFFLLHFNPRISIREVEKFDVNNLRSNDCICLNNIAEYIMQN